MQLVANQYKTTAGGFNDPILRDNVRSVRFSAVYEAFDRYKGANLAALQFSQGLDVFRRQQNRFALFVACIGSQ
ncbi:MAG: hypothetical protein WDO24_06810 [Pseudomonadota bacterium]